MIKAFILCVICSLGFATAEAAVEGNVVMKVNPVRAMVNLGELKVNVGDRVSVYRQECVGAKLPNCRKERVGGGVVARVLNESYSEVLMDEGVSFKSDYLIERE